MIYFRFQDNRKLAVHSLVFAANSKYLKPWMETTFVPDLNVSYVTFLELKPSESKTNSLVSNTSNLAFYP
jgi:hypothetical protein